ncbi:MAG: DNA cytosine methyltransferase [Acidobacteriota bacterium]|nr:DNA cytosine methyltransferase [Acidobacteriota bacterium]
MTFEHEAFESTSYASEIDVEQEDLSFGADEKTTPERPQEVDVEICAGAGGMALGLERAGFTGLPTYFYEVDKDACRSLRANIRAGNINGKVRCCDVKKVDWAREIKAPVRLFSGGVPCQPFSLGGKHLAYRDGRNLFPVAMEAIRTLKPRAILIENVAGLARKDFRPYLDYIILQMKYPGVPPREDESWEEHQVRIEREIRAGTVSQTYQVNWDRLNAANYGLPQKRCRVLIMALRCKEPLEIKFPNPTHARVKLVAEIMGGTYWERMGIAPRAFPDRFPLKAPKIGTKNRHLLPWVTVREALRSLEELYQKNKKWAKKDAVKELYPGINPRCYKGHTGCPQDWPAKTIKAGVHGVPGGENIVHTDEGGIRYFTLREAAVVQGFPPNYLFKGNACTITSQIGNAVPVPLIEVVARHLLELLSSGSNQ